MHRNSEQLEVHTVMTCQVFTATSSRDDDDESCSPLQHVFAVLWCALALALGALLGFAVYLLIYSGVTLATTLAATS